MTIEGITISHPDRVIFPEAGITKGEVAAYYARVAPMLLPHITRRPLSVVRCPEGRQKKCFYQKHHSAGMPAAIKTVRLEGKSRDKFLTIDSAQGLLALVQFGVLEFHPWLARNDRLDRPDMMVFDLDPSDDVAWEEVLGGAFLVRDTLAELGLQSFAKVTGGKGLHVVVPLTRRAGFDLLKPAARTIAEHVRRQSPENFLTTADKARRKGRIYLDWLRNARGATAVAPYSVRARPGAPVAVPLAWSEVTPDLRPDQFTIHTLPRHLARQRKEAWADFFNLNQSLPRSALSALQ